MSPEVKNTDKNIHSQNIDMVLCCLRDLHFPVLFDCIKTEDVNV